MECKIDIQALIQQIKDKAMLEILLHMTPDEQTKDLLEKVMSIFTQHGVSIEQALDIMKDISEAIKTNEEENENAEN